jgi:type IV secretion system protein VirD4
MDAKTLKGIYAELTRHVVLYVTDDDIEKALSKEFPDEYIKPKDLEKDDIYIMIPEYLLEDWKNLLTLMISQFLTYFERRKDRESTAILFLLDEFARLGKIERMTNALATLRSKGITICLILQSLAQLDLIYGKETRSVMCDTCSYKAILSASDPDTQKAFSELVGTYDRHKLTYSRNKNYTIFPIPSAGRGEGISVTTEDRKIIKPEEFATLPDIVLLTPFGFFRVEKKYHYLQPYYVE